MRTILTTPRLTLRELDESDLEFVATLLGDPEVMRYWPRPHTHEESRAWIRRQQDRYAQHGHGYWLALEMATGRPVGQAGVLRLTVEDETQESLGYIIHRPFWRRGFAFEAATAC